MFLERDTGVTGTRGRLENAVALRLKFGGLKPSSYELRAKKLSLGSCEPWFTGTGLAVLVMEENGPPSSFQMPSWSTMLEKTALFLSGTFLLCMWYDESGFWDRGPGSQDEIGTGSLWPLCLQ